jgi:molecular chaperone GrpE
LFCLNFCLEYEMSKAKHTGPVETASPAPADVPTAVETGPEPTDADLKKALAEAQAKSQEHYDTFLRAKAEAENTRRRAAEDVSKAHKFGIEKFAEALLAVKDSLDAALVVENTSIESFKTGVELTARQLNGVFEKFSVTEIDPLGEVFDPRRHQAIASVDSEQEPNTVVTVLQKGYLLHDRVLRPALVAVAKARASEE